MARRPALDYAAVFAASRHAYLLLDRELRIVDANRAYLDATLTEHGALVDRHMFEAFPDNPADPGADGTRMLGASLERVVASATFDAMALQRYDIRRPDGTFEERYWDPLNTPVLSGDGQVELIIHHVIDVTERVRSGESFWRTPGLPEPVHRAELPGVLRAHEAAYGRTGKALRSSAKILRHSKDVLLASRAQIDDSQARIAASMALLNKPSR